MRLSSIRPALALAAMLPGAALADTILPVFADAEFLAGAEIDNPYFPIAPGATTVLVAEGIDDEGEAFEERSELSHAGDGRVILGVQTTAVLDRAYEDELLVEETYDYFAQDTEGNVWYLGEDVVNFLYDDDDQLIGTTNDSAWIAGENGALPGWIMPAVPSPGLAYYQEYAAADAALDQALIFDVLVSLTVGGQEFTDVLRIFETTELDPDAREFKYYAPGLGIIRVEEGLDEDLANPELVFEITDLAPVPLPGGMLLLAGGLAALGLGLRRRA